MAFVRGKNIPPESSNVYYYLVDYYYTEEDGKRIRKQRQKYVGKDPSKANDYLKEFEGGAQWEEVAKDVEPAPRGRKAKPKEEPKAAPPTEPTYNLNQDSLDQMVDGVPKEESNDSHRRMVLDAQRKLGDIRKEDFPERVIDTHEDGWRYVRLPNDKYHTQEASLTYNRSGKYIELYDKFFDLSKESKEHVLLHEKGHGLESDMDIEDKMRLLNSPHFKNNAEDAGNLKYLWWTANQDEALAESYANYIDNPEEFQKKYPEEYRLMDELVRTKRLDSLKNEPATVAPKEPRLKIRTEVVGAHDNQVDSVIIATDKKGKVVGTLEYAIYDDKPSVSMIQVAESERGKGIATALMDELVKEYDYHDISQGMRTEDGGAFIAAYEKKRGIKPKPAPEVHVIDDPAVTEESVKTMSMNELGDRMDALHDAEYDWTKSYDHGPFTNVKKDIIQAEFDRRYAEMEKAEEKEYPAISYVNYDRNNPYPLPESRDVDGAGIKEGSKVIVATNVAQEGIVKKIRDKTVDIDYDGRIFKTDKRWIINVDGKDLLSKAKNKADKDVAEHTELVNGRKKLINDLGIKIGDAIHVGYEERKVIRIRNDGLIVHDETAALGDYGTIGVMSGAITNVPMADVTTEPSEIVMLNGKWTVPEDNPKRKYLEEQSQSPEVRAKKAYDEGFSQGMETDWSNFADPNEELDGLRKIAEDTKNNQIGEAHWKGRYEGAVKSYEQYQKSKEPTTTDPAEPTQPIENKEPFENFTQRAKYPSNITKGLEDGANTLVPDGTVQQDGIERTQYMAVGKDYRGKQLYAFVKRCPRCGGGGTYLFDGVTDDCYRCRGFGYETKYYYRNERGTVVIIDDLERKEGRMKLIDDFMKDVDKTDIPVRVNPKGIDTNMLNKMLKDEESHLSTRNFQGRIVDRNLMDMAVQSTENYDDAVWLYMSIKHGKMPKDEALWRHSIEQYRRWKPESVSDQAARNDTYLVDLNTYEVRNKDFVEMPFENQMARAYGESPIADYDFVRDSETMAEEMAPRMRNVTDGELGAIIDRKPFQEFTYKKITGAQYRTAVAEQKAAAIEMKRRTIDGIISRKEVPYNMVVDDGSYKFLDVPIGKGVKTKVTEIDMVIDEDGKMEEKVVREIEPLGFGSSVRKGYNDFASTLRFPLRAGRVYEVEQPNNNGYSFTTKYNVNNGRAHKIEGWHEIRYSDVKLNIATPEQNEQREKVIQEMKEKLDEKSKKRDEKKKAQLEEAWGKADEPSIILTTQPNTKTWMAEIVGPHHKYGLDRQFVRESARKGDEMAFPVEKGRIYEVESAQTGRMFVTIIDGEIRTLSKNDVIDYFKGNGAMPVGERSGKISLSGGFNKEDVIESNKKIVESELADNIIRSGYNEYRLLNEIPFDRFNKLRDSGVIIKNRSTDKWIINNLYLSEDIKKRADEKYDAIKNAKETASRRKEESRPIADPYRNHPLNEIKYFEGRTYRIEGKPFSNEVFNALKAGGELQYYDSDYLESVYGDHGARPGYFLSVNPKSAYILENAGIKTGTPEQYRAKTEGIDDRKRRFAEKVKSMTLTDGTLITEKTPEIAALESGSKTIIKDPIDPPNATGGGKEYWVTDDAIYVLEHNGADGDDWRYNTIGNSRVYRLERSQSNLNKIEMMKEFDIKKETEGTF